MDSSITDMLIEIKIKKSDFIPRNKVNDSHFFSEMARVSEAGYHRIILKRGLAKRIVDRFDLSTRHKKRITTIGQNYYRSYAFLDTPLELHIPKLSVNYGDDELVKTGEFKWQIGHNTLIEKKYHEKTILLAEDEYDCSFYKILFRTVAKRINFGSIEFDELPGGGINTSRSFQKNVNEKTNIVVCICDSDQLVPDGEFKDTYNKVLEKSDELNFIGRVVCTPGHELENFIPVEIIHSVTKNNSQETTDNLIDLIDSQGTVAQYDCVHLYYDLKKGVTESGLKSACFTKAQKSWVQKKYGNFFNLSPKEELPVYGNKILGEFLKKMTKDNEKQFVDEYENFLDSDYWEKHFSEWVLSLLWFFCGDDKKIKTED